MASTALAVEAAEKATADALQGALDLLPQGFLQFEDPSQLLTNPPEDEEEREDRISEELNRFVSPLVQSQSKQLTEKPVVTSTDKLLNSILPPRVFSFHDPTTNLEQVMVQPPSKEQATRNELRELREILDFKLDDARARDKGICPVRRSIYGMLFDELIRQVTINCPERGLMLLRIRDEARLSIDAYKSLYDASAQYGATKLHQASKGKPEMLTRIELLTSETDALRKEVRRLETKHLSLLRSSEEQKAADQKRFNDEKVFLERTETRLKNHLDAVKQMQEAERRALMSGNVDE